ncbi:type IV toxin-antitoxin system AbiEi family antitoxin domain-containing protein [bacterium]|nr:type IV toxin-antitoxin system AbiEi family antitoxin domain-containing protein [bacterium]
MNTLNILKNIAAKNNGLILTKTASDYGISRMVLSNYCKSGKITRVAVGQYVFPEDLNDEMFSLGIRSDYIIFSHETALFLNGISERIPFEHTVTIPSSKSLSRSISNGCKIYYIKDTLYDVGKTKLTTPMGNKVSAYDMERTICDIVRSRSRIADETFIAAIKNYAENPNKNLANLSLYATKMGVLSQVRKYLEVLL